MANLISAGLFGDGAAAVIVAGADCVLPGVAGPTILATRSVFYPNTEEMMGWAISEKGFRIVLSRDVPKLVRTRAPSRQFQAVADHVGQFLDLGGLVVVRQEDGLALFFEVDNFVGDSRCGYHRGGRN